ncbi:carbohydrate ABC transporter permease [Pumilibacter intestinalis]|uniref:carbohydrate ABC transporter permease n=1 Tax=Pumilibacter intestinalis TaxID=2941511 RepID=UPI002040276B|nr:sugar ABC transporter permease [Pumilibacter intestinalis]
MVKAVKKIKWKDEVVGWLFILPVVLGVLIFTATPLVYAFIESFFETPLREFSFTEWGTFVGLKNYYRNFTTYAYSSRFWQSLKVTAVYAVINVPLQLALSFLLALLLNREMRGMKFIRALFYLPVLIPPVCSGILWNQLTDVNYGVMNSILTAIGIEGWGWFNEASSSMPSLIFIGLFNLGGSMILWLAQLKNIPKSLYESARIDGANKFVQVVKITVPMCAPMIIYNLVMSIIATLQTYDLVATLVNMGGVQNSMLFYVVNIYQYRVGQFGYSCALSFILFFITAALSLVVMRFSKNAYYGEEG